MYQTCLFCNESLGANDVVEQFPIGRRLAFDAERGRLWVVCIACGRWNLSPIEERWEAIEDCERCFRATHLRYSTENIGLAQLRKGLQLIRIGKALRPEVAAWRYGDEIARRGSGLLRAIGTEVVLRGLRVVNRTVSVVTDFVAARDVADDPLTRLRLFSHRMRVLDVTTDDRGRRIVLRHGHLNEAELLRPSPSESWRMLVRHDHGVATISGDDGLRTVAKILATLNASGATADEVRYATSKIEDAEDADGYFSRIVALAMRTHWGRNPDGQAPTEGPASASLAERLALHITNRSFWARGAIGSESQTLLLRLPMVDRLALEMAANEDAERRALEGELTELETAWREAEEIAAIADGLFGDEELERFRREHALRSAGVARE